MHTRKELEAHYVEKGSLSCDSDAPQVGSARSDSTRVVKVNHHKTNFCKMRPYCIHFATVTVKHLPDPIYTQIFVLNVPCYTILCIP
jgi:hypothetical protein